MTRADIVKPIGTSREYRKQFALLSLPGAAFIFVGLFLSLPSQVEGLTFIQAYAFPALSILVGIWYVIPYLIDLVNPTVMQLTGQIIDIEIKKPATRRGFYLFIQYKLLFTDEKVWTYRSGMIDTLQKGQYVSVVFGRKSRYIVQIETDETYS
ncbi:MAG: hypothetical protein KDD92_06550 [Caldilineaceae bacterium]|nr:hypothetical protein [Caldilineaceae bacterium]